MYQIDNQSRIPVYEQIVQQIELYILMRIINSGDQLPSVRSLSMQLHVNPNTVQRAYTELDKRGLLTSTVGIGSFISENALKYLQAERKERIYELKPRVRELRLSGIEKSTIVGIVDEVYSEAIPDKI